MLRLNGGCSGLTTYLGPTFHPGNEQPKAPCPVCIDEKGDDHPKELYSLRGFKPGEHDPIIPRFWFNTPPLQLVSDGKEMQALRVCHSLASRRGPG